MASGSISFAVEFTGLERLDKLSMPSLDIPKFDFPKFELPSLTPFQIGLSAAFTAGVVILRAGLELFSKGLEQVFSNAAEGLKLKTGLDKALQSGAIKSGETKAEFSKNLQPTILKLIGNDSIATPLADIQSTVSELAGLGVTSKQQVELLPMLQNFTGGIGGEASLQESSVSLVGQMQKLSLPLDEKSVATVVGLNTALMNTSKLTVADISVFNKYATINTDGTEKGTVASATSNAVIASLLSNRGMTAESAGVSFRAMQLAMVDQKKLDKSGFVVAQTNADGSRTTDLQRMESVVKQFLEFRQREGADAALQRVNKLGGDVGMGAVTAFAGMKPGDDVFGKAAKEFDLKMKSASTEMATRAKEAAGGLSGASAAMDNSVEGMQLKLADSFEGLKIAQLKGSANILNQMFPEKALAALKIELDGLGNGLLSTPVPQFVSAFGGFLLDAIATGAKFGKLLVIDPGVVAAFNGVGNGFMVAFRAIGEVVKGLVMSLMVIGKLLVSFGVFTLVETALILLGVVGQLIGLVFQVGAALFGASNGTSTMVLDFSNLKQLAQSMSDAVASLTPLMVGVATAVNQFVLPVFQFFASITSAISETITGLASVIAGVFDQISSLAGVLSNLKLPDLTGQLKAGVEATVNFVTGKPSTEVEGSSFGLSEVVD